MLTLDAIKTIAATTPRPMVPAIGYQLPFQMEVGRRKALLPASTPERQAQLRAVVRRVIAEHREVLVALRDR